MARLDAADRQGALKVMGKLFEELAAATNASGKDIKRENNADKDKKYLLTNQYTRKESVRLKPGQDSLFTRFNNLVVAGALKDAYNLDLETTDGKVKFGSLKKPTEGANYGNVAEGVFAAALAARFSSGRAKQMTNADDVYRMIRKINPSSIPGRTSQKAVFQEQAPNFGTPLKDIITCTITLAKVNMDFLRNPQNTEALRDYVNASLTYANRQSVRDWVDTIYRNGRQDRVEIDADGVTNEKTSKIDVKVSITDDEGKMYRGVNINASIKADDVKQFGQVGGNSFNAVSRFFTQAIGETMSGASGEFAQKKRVPTKLRTIYKAANTIINNNLNNPSTSAAMASKIGTGISRFATQDNAGVVDPESGDTVELINLSSGEATIYNFKNVAQKLSQYKLKSEYGFSGDFSLPTITIRESETNKIVIYLRSKAEYVKDKKTGGKKLYYRNLVEKGQFLTELIATSATENPVTSS